MLLTVHPQVQPMKLQELDVGQAFLPVGDTLTESWAVGIAAAYPRPHPTGDGLRYFLTFGSDGARVNFAENDITVLALTGRLRAITEDVPVATGAGDRLWKPNLLFRGVKGDFFAAYVASPQGGSDRRGSYDCSTGLVASDASILGYRALAYSTWRLDLFECSDAGNQVTTIYKTPSEQGG